MKLQELYEAKKVEQGVYAGVKFSTETKDSIKTFLDEHKIENPIDADKLHCTLLYSRKPCPDYEPQGNIDPPIVAKAGKFEVWESPANENKDHITYALVLNLKTPELVERHNELMDEHDATYDYPSYKPHTTFSYDVGKDFKVDALPNFPEDIVLVEEYDELLDVDKVIS